MKKIIAAVALVAAASSAFATAGVIPLAGMGTTTTCSTSYNQTTCYTR